ncbi:MAG: MBL fold metallo-hydrolase [Pirellulaceae bacterium]|nr:MBL fold metallo-hydrolase [Pirellulaceae bacterium]
MKLLILGTAGYHPSETRQTTCLMLPSEGIVFDAGTSFFRVREHLVTPTLDILLSHTHLDHSVGLTFLLDVLLHKATERVTVHAAADKLATIENHLFADQLFPVPPRFERRPTPPRWRLAGGVEVTAFPLDHPGGSQGYRLDWPERSLAFVTDTTSKGAESPYLDQVRGVDLLVHECNFRDEQAEFANLTGHSCVSPVLKLAAAAGVKRLVLTHFNPLETDADPVGLAAARGIFPSTLLAVDGMEIDF